MSAVDETCRRCAACGKGGDGGLGLKRCLGCKITFYCGKDCQHSHWQTHKKECKQLLEEALFRQPPPREECPLCMLPLPFGSETFWSPCCSKTICTGCVYSTLKAKGETPMKINGTWRSNVPTECAFCRTPLCSSDEEFFERLNKKMAANDADAYHNLACKYLDGYMGLERDPEKAEKLYLKAASLGSYQAHCALGIMYFFGRGIAMNEKKAIHHFQIAAIGGDPQSRHNLGGLEFERGNITVAKRHWMISASVGFDEALKTIRMGYEDGWASKDEYAEALRACQKAMDEVTSEERTKAQKTGSSWNEDMSHMNNRPGPPRSMHHRKS